MIYSGALQALRTEVPGLGPGDERAARGHVLPYPPISSPVVEVAVVEVAVAVVVVVVVVVVAAAVVVVVVVVVVAAGRPE